MKYLMFIFKIRRFKKHRLMFHLNHNIDYKMQSQDYFA